MKETEEGRIPGEKNRGGMPGERTEEGCQVKETEGGVRGGGGCVRKSVGCMGVGWMGMGGGR